MKEISVVLKYLQFHKRKNEITIETIIHYLALIAVQGRSYSITITK